MKRSFLLLVLLSLFKPIFSMETKDVQSEIANNQSIEQLKLLVDSKFDEHKDLRILFEELIDIFDSATFYHINSGHLRVQLTEHIKNKAHSLYSLKNETEEQLTQKLENSIDDILYEPDIDEEEIYDDIIRFIISGADFDTIIEYQDREISLLSLCCSAREINPNWIVPCLFIYGANVNSLDPEKAPLRLAAQYHPENLKLIRLLIIFGTQLNEVVGDATVNTKAAEYAINRLGQTLDEKTLNVFLNYHYLLGPISRSGNLLLLDLPSAIVLKLLIKHGYPINAQDQDGWTLMRNIISLPKNMINENVVFELVNILLAAGGEDLPDNKGLTAEGMAVYQGYNKVAALLKNAKWHSFKF